MSKPMFSLSIGYPGAIHEEEALDTTGLTIEEWNALTDEQKSDYAEEWASNYIEVCCYVEEDE